MGIDNSKYTTKPTLEEIKDALEKLKKWSSLARSYEIDALDPKLNIFAHGLPDRDNYALKRIYPKNFFVDSSYKDSLPDIQNMASNQNGNDFIQKVGISNFKLPLRFKRKDGDQIELEAKITGTVSLSTEKKGINMSRIMRSFYKYASEKFSFEVINKVLDAYKKDLDSFDAHIQISISLPQKIKSLRSGLEGFQYYDFMLESIDNKGKRQRFLHFNYVYSSTCPCSLELSEHARHERNQLANAHSQRSVAQISVKLKDCEEYPLWFEDLITLCRQAVPTEVQVMVKREDEQAFAELNAAHPIFVEDAVRLLAARLRADKRIGDFKIVANHKESLHAHDAISILYEGKTFENAPLDMRIF